MKHLVVKVFLLIVIIFNVNLLQAQQAKYIVLITIDGLRPEFYLDSSWGMVNLRHLMDSGVAAEGVTPVFPSVTYPDHTTMITGVTPAKHGIYYNTPFRPTGESGQSYVYYDSINVETLFDAMKKAGRTTADVIWPVTVHAPVTYNVPDIAQPGNKDRRSITEQNVNPPALWKTLQDSAVGYLQWNDWNLFNDELAMDENIGRMGSYFIRTYKPGLTAIHFAAPDHYEHAYGREGYVIRAAVQGVDRGIKSILEAISRAGINDSTTIIVTGDHGFENIYRSFNPNIILKQAGLLTNIKEDKWKAQFFQSGGSTFLFLKNPKDVETLQQVQNLLKTVPDSIKSYFKIINKSELRNIGADPRVVLALIGLKGTSFGNTSDGSLITTFPKLRGTHGFYPDHKEMLTGFVAYGAGIAKGVTIKNMNMTDICPIIIKLTGLPFHKMDGKLYPQMFEK